MDAKLANELVELTLVRVSVITKLSHLNPSHFAWLIGRLRGYFYAEYAHRKALVGPRPPLSTPNWRGHCDLLVALATLSVEQREALIMIDRGVALQRGRPNLPSSFLDLQEVRRAGAGRPRFGCIRRRGRDANECCFARSLSRDRRSRPELIAADRREAEPIAAKPNRRRVFHYLT
jgi:hypothetical protein